MAKRQQNNNTTALIDGLTIKQESAIDNPELQRAKAQVVELETRIRELEENGATREDIEDYIERSSEKSIVAVDNNLWRFRKFELSPTTIIPPSKFDIADADELGYMLAKLESASQFWLGEWASWYVANESDNQKRSKAYKDLAEQFDVNPRTLQNYANVCRNLPSSLRREDVSFSIHRMVAECHKSLKNRQGELLNWASENHATAKQFAEYLSSLTDSPEEEPEVVKNYLFSKDRQPKLAGLETIWSKARNKDRTARTKVIGTITEFRKWLDELEESLDE